MKTYVSWIGLKGEWSESQCIYVDHGEMNVEQACDNLRLPPTRFYSRFRRLAIERASTEYEERKPKNGLDLAKYSGAVYTDLLPATPTASQIAAILGSMTSDAKKLSSAENGKRGGRPRKKIEEDPQTPARS